MQIGALELLDALARYIFQPQCQLEDVPYSISDSSISRKKLQRAYDHKLSQVHHASGSPDLLARLSIESDIAKK